MSEGKRTRKLKKEYWQHGVGMEVVKWSVQERRRGLAKWEKMQAKRNRKL